jgi:hypothetical protein
MAPNLQRHIVTLRGYLNALDEKELTLEAEGQSIDPAQAKAFRQGTDDALAAPLVVTWSKLLGADASIERASVENDLSTFYEKYAAENARRERYGQFDIMEMTKAVCCRALTATADMVVTGSVADERHYGGGFQPHPVNPDDPRKSLLRDAAFRINHRLMPEDRKHMTVRDMVKHGDWFFQIGLGKENRQTHITKLQYMPVREMGFVKDPTPERMYGYTPLTATEPIKTWPAWKIAHFCNRISEADLYGRGIFMSSLRAWIQVEALESGMMQRRLERSPMRYKHVLDLSHLNTEEEMRKAKADYRRNIRKTRTVESSGNHQFQKITPPVGEDFIVGKKGENSPADVEAIQGDATLGDIGDFNHFYSSFLSGLGPPKHQLGYEQDTMRSMGTELHIIFARRCRATTMRFIQGLHHLYWVELLLRRVDPRDFPYVIFPPAMGTRDELVRAQVQLAHATTVRYLADAFSKSGKMPSINWFLRHIMNLDDEAIDGLGELELVASKGDDRIKDTSGDPATPGGASGDSALVAKALENDAVASELRYTRFLLNERALSKMTPQQFYDLNLGCETPNVHPDTLIQQLELNVGAEPYCWA